MQMEGQVIQVNLDDIIPNRFQPRIAFDEKGLNELASSIKEHGIIQPLVLRKLGKKYEIIAGERRYKAATLAGLQTVPAVISNIDDNKSAEVALVENIQRRDLTPIEEARSYKNLLDKGYLTQEQLAKKMGLSQSAIANKLRLLNLDNSVQQALLDGKISERHARSLLSLTNMEDQKKWLDRIVNERLTVKQLDELLKKASSDDGDSGDVPLVNLTPNIEDIKEESTDIFDNKPKNIANMLVSEDTMTEYSDNLQNQELNNVSVDTLNVDAPAAPETKEQAPVVEEQPSVSPFNDIVNNTNNSQEVLNDVPPTNNKFFNQLEDEPATLDNLNPFAPDANFQIDQTPTQDNEIEIFDIPTNNSVATKSTPSPEVVAPIIDQEPIIQDSVIPTMDELNPNNKFFQPIQEQAVANPVIDVSTEQTPVNPMDYVNKLNNTDVQEEQSNASLKDAINEIRGLVENLNVRGLNITIDEADLEASYQMNISIMK